MKSMKKLVLAGLILLASVVGLLPLVGCKNDSVPEVPKYTVKFAKGNNTEVVSDLPSNLMVESGTVLTAEQLKPLTNTEKYAFVGWYDGETKAVAGTYTVTKDVTLTAQWKKAIRVTQMNLDEGLDKAITDPDSILVLEENITVKTPINIESGNVTIDLNGKTLKNESGTVVQVAENATLTIMDTGKGGSISGVGFGVDNYGSLTVEGGSISGDTYGVQNFNSGTLEVTGGIISADGANSFGVSNYGILTVEGGSISGDNSGVNNYGRLTVEGGSISASGANSSGVINNDSLTLEGGSISGVDYGVQNFDSGTLKVTGGIISADGANSFGVENNGTLEVTGGIISADGENSYGVSNYGILTVEGGSISGVDYGVFSRGTLNLSGAPKITTFYLTSPITIVGDLTDDNPSYSVEWKGDTTDGTTIVVGGEQVTLTADIAQKFTFKDIEVEFEESTKALVVKN